MLAAATAALAAAQALAFIDRAAQLATANGTLEVVLPDWQWQRRTLAAARRLHLRRRGRGASSPVVAADVAWYASD